MSVIEGAAQRFARLLTVIAVAATLVAACGDGSADPGGGATTGAAAPKPTQGGTFVYPCASEPVLLAPYCDQWGDDQQVAHQILEGLVRYEEQRDGSLKTVPCLAESWTSNANATVWTFRLRRGVTFQAPVDREVTASDVVASFAYLADPANASPLAWQVGLIRGTDSAGYSRRGRLGVEALDRYTVRFTLKSAHAEFAATLGAQGLAVWPVDYMRKVGADAFARRPVGTGPYRFGRRVEGRWLSLERNTRWWDKSGGPYVDALRFEVLNSPQAQVLAFQKGTIDYTSVQQDQVRTAKTLPQVKNGQWQARAWPLLGVNYLCFNMKDPVVGGTSGLRLRQALAYGCDREALIEGPGDEAWRLPAGLLAPGVPGWRTVPFPYRYDPARAAALYEQAGSPVVRLWILDSRKDLEVARTLKAGYAKAGIAVKIQSYSWDDFAARASEADGDQTFRLGWIGVFPGQSDWLPGLLFQEFTFYSDAGVDALLARAVGTVDERTRLGLYAEAQQEIVADVPVIPLYVYTEFSLVNNRIAGFVLTPLGVADLWKIWVR